METAEQKQSPETQSGLSDFLPFAREKGIRISAPEWMNFLGVIESIAQSDLIDSDDFYDTLKSVGGATLVKDKSDIAIYSDAFDEFFRDMKQAHEEKLQAEQETQSELATTALTATELTQPEQDKSSEVESDEHRVGETPDIKEQLGITDVNENLDVNSDESHDDDETVHGGDKDQHNDILKKADESKDGGGDKGNNTRPGDGTEQGNSEGKGKDGTGETHKDDVGHAYDGIAKEKTEFGVIGDSGGKGKYNVATGRHDPEPSAIVQNSQIRKYDLSENIRHKDRREKYNIRPNRTDVAEIVKNLRRIITDVSDTRSHTIDIKHTVDNFSKKDFRFDYENEREVKPEVVLFIDIGGPMDEWIDLMEELTQGMSRGLLKLEIYMFHNQLYGYAWDPKDGNYPKPNGLKSVRDIVKKRKKVIIYGDADMAESEVEYDNWPPRDNEEKIARYGMDGTDCLEYIKRNSENAVWINPIFKSNWYYDEHNDQYDTNNSVAQIADMLPMYDLSIGGVQDAIADLMKKC